MGRNDLCFCGSGKKQKKCHNDIEPNSAFAQMILFHNKTDMFIKENTQFEKLKCKKGCSECCYQNFSVSTVEFYYIIYQIIKNQGIAKAREYVTKGYEMWCEYEKEFPENAKLLRLNTESANPNKFMEMMKLIEKSVDGSPMFNKFPCPFLNVEEKCCEVYEYRPFICRHYGVGYIEKHDLPVGFCSHTIDGADYQQFMADLSEFKDNAVDMDIYYSSKYDQTAFDREYPIFYFCKITYEHFDNLEFKITERKDISKDRLSDNRLDRLMQRQRR